MAQFLTDTTETFGRDVIVPTFSSQGCVVTTVSQGLWAGKLSYISKSLLWVLCTPRNSSLHPEETTMVTAHQPWAPSRSQPSHTAESFRISPCCHIRHCQLQHPSLGPQCSQMLNREKGPRSHLVATPCPWLPRADRLNRPSISNCPWEPSLSHMRPRVALNAAQCKIANPLKTLSFCL